jgi:hypothetical protein
MSDRQSIDPSRAIVDLDVLTLQSATVRHVGAAVNPVTGGVAEGYVISIRLTGGFGRVPDQEGRPTMVDRLDELTASGMYFGPTAEELDTLRTLLNKWRDGNLPLRFLDFTDHALLLEDGSNFVTIPAGDRHVTAANPTPLDEV